MWFLIVYLCCAALVGIYKYVTHRGETVSGSQLIMAGLVTFVPIVNMVSAFICLIILAVVAGIWLETKLKKSPFWNKQFTIKGKK